MQSLQILLRLKQAAIILVCVLGFTASELAFVGSTYAASMGGGSPYITITSPNIEVNIHGCATIPVDGEGFTPAGMALFAITAAGSGKHPTLSVSPTSVSVAANGNFFIPLYVCNLADLVGESTTTSLLLTVIDKASGRSTGAVTVNISVPVPSIYSNVSIAPLLNNCGTVVIFGDGFVASTWKPNYASIQGFKGIGGTQLRGSAKANVLVNGNIATSIQLCGLKVGDTFSVQAVDTATHQRSGYLSFTAVEVTPTPVTDDGDSDLNSDLR
ncbi:MAG: hypothetical protein NVSMB44_27820 [Ktedonobacteraceae bacterium]